MWVLYCLAENIKLHDVFEIRLNRWKSHLDRIGQLHILGGLDDDTHVQLGVIGIAISNNVYVVSR